MPKAHVKKNDEVVVIAGSELGKRGKIMLVNNKTQRVLLEGIKMIKRHTKKSTAHPNGAIIEREGTIHISNVMLADKYDKRAAAKGNAAPAQEPAEA
jgi:large subunit ribosomal protein L24